MSSYAEETVKRKFGWRRHCEVLEGYLLEAVERRKKLARRAKIV